MSRIKTVEVRLRTKEGKFISGSNKMVIKMDMGEDVDHVSFVNPDSELKNNVRVDIALKPENIKPFLETLNEALDEGWEIHEIALVNTDGEVAFSETKFHYVKKNDVLPNTVTVSKGDKKNG